MSEERQPPAREPLPGSRKRGTRTGPPPSRGGRRGRATRPMDPARPCLNCGDPTPGEYCPTCGQRKVDVQVSVRVLMMDVLEDQFILDRRLPRTLSSLLFRPGRLTVEFVNGRIASYVHPFRLYLVSSLIFFLLLSFLSLRLVRRASLDAAEPDAPPGLAGLAADSARLLELDEELRRIDGVLADSGLPGPAAAGVETGRVAVLRSRERVRARIDSALAAAGAAAAAADTAAADTPVADTAAADTPVADTAAGTDSVSAEAETPAAAGSRTVSEMFGWDDGEGPTISFPVPAVEEALEARVARLGAMEPRDALESLLRTFLGYVPTLMFVLLPVFALVLKLLYIRRGRYYAEHFVFLLHAHSFVFLLSTVMLLARAYVAAWLELALFGWILVYILIALRRVYGQGWVRTFIKYWILGWMYVWILAIALPFAVLASLLFG